MAFGVQGKHILFQVFSLCPYFTLFERKEVGVKSLTLREVHKLTGDIKSSYFLSYLIAMISSHFLLVTNLSKVKRLKRVVKKPNVLFIKSRE